MPNHPNDAHHDFIEWLLEFIRETVECIREKNNSLHEELIYASVSHISKMYWEYLSECSEFNLLTLYNLERDLLFIYRFCGKHFSRYKDVVEKMRSLQ